MSFVCLDCVAHIVSEWDAIESLQVGFSNYNYLDKKFDITPQKFLRERIKEIKKSKDEMDKIKNRIEIFDDDGNLGSKIEKLAEIIEKESK